MFLKTFVGWGLEIAHGKAKAYWRERWVKEHVKGFLNTTVDAVRLSKCNYFPGFVSNEYEEGTDDHVMALMSLEI